ncbi:WD40 repeat-like protein [Coniochaeta ligniaria NRRL 30616]|uniref:Mitochondrial division protein 1 n=1 Tax=Coniochaeta ligniaria NRRL 30616 TaxID=1408157 RepID=A0A1J7J6I4_9PEZI|nr:WD40 repeat-like protein [Coniochaeta ligniaria NRRL 30616]
MSDVGAAGAAGDIPGRAVGPPSKRRRVADDGNDTDPSTSRYASRERRDSPAAEVDERHSHDLSIRRGPKPSLSPRPGSDIRGKNKPDNTHYRGSNSQTSSPPSRSRSHSSQRQRLYSRSNSRSRSRRGSRTPGSDGSRSRSRSRSRAPFDSRSQSQTRSRTSSSRRHRDRTSRSPTTHTQKRKPDYQPHLRLTGHGAAVSQVRISPDGRWLASASADGTAKIWDAETGEHMDTLVGHMAGVSCLAWAPDGDSLATGGDDKAIRLWDRVTASPAHAVGEGAGRGEDSGYGTMRRRVNGGILRPGTGAGSGKGARGTRNGRGPLLGHHNYVYCLAFSPKGNILASGSYDEAVFLWDVRAGRLMRSLPAHSDPVSGIGFSRDGTLVASCSTDGLIRIWDTSTGQCLRTLVHEDNPAVTNVCFSPNGRFVLAFNLDNSIRMWDYVSGSVKKTYQGHKNSGFSIGGSFGVLGDARNGDENPTAARNRGDAFVASASEDGDIVMWDVKSKEIVQRIPRAHKGVCFWVDVNGDIMASAGQDRIINVFKNQPASKRKAFTGINEADTNGFGGQGEDSVTPYEGAADDELQRQVEAGVATPPVKQEHIKEEQL